jgi:hypothetical protein
VDFTGYVSRGMDLAEGGAVLERLLGQQDSVSRGLPSLWGPASSIALWRPPNPGRGAIRSCATGASGAAMPSRPYGHRGRK